jgi:hypothetical protein
MATSIAFRRLRGGLSEVVIGWRLAVLIGLTLNLSLQVSRFTDRALRSYDADRAVVVLLHCAMRLFVY